MSNAKKVAQHKFSSPFIYRAIKSRRYKFSEDLGRRSHKSINDKGDLVNNSKLRPIMYSTHIDSHVYSYYAHEIIQPKYEKLLKSDNELDKSIKLIDEFLLMMAFALNTM